MTVSFQIVSNLQLKDHTTIVGFEDDPLVDSSGCEDGVSMFFLPDYTASRLSYPKIARYMVQMLT
jgi:hypothetical protein